MAKIRSGGAYGNPTGKAGGLVWGGARTPQGHRPTIREYVVPLDRKSSSQLDRRSLFRSATCILNSIGSYYWRDAWDAGLHGLAGYDRMTQWLLANLEKVGVLTRWKVPILNANLGASYQPGLDRYGRGSDYLCYTVSTECKGDHCSGDDVIKGFCTLRNSPDTPNQIRFLLTGAENPGYRGLSTVLWVRWLIPGEEYVVVMWLEHTEPDGSITASPTTNDVWQTTV